MGLDMYLFKLNNKTTDKNPIEMAYWRKHPRLHLYMEKLWSERTGLDQEFNCQRLYLDKEDIDDVLSYCKEELESFNQESEEENLGFFFGNTCKEHWEDSIEAFEFALKNTNFETEQLYYDSWW